MIRLHTVCLALVMLLSLVLHPSTASATEVGKGKNFGIGFAVGDPMALVGKVFIDKDNAVDFGVGFFRLWNRCRTRDGARICGGFGSVTFNADYLWEFEIVEGRSAKLDWHIGAGGRLWLADSDDNQDLAIAGRMPVGIDLTFQRPDFIEVYLEVAPAMYVFPDFGVAPEGNLGVRFYF
jgi:hypothetical protein